LIEARTARGEQAGGYESSGESAAIKTWHQVHERAELKEPNALARKAAVLQVNRALDADRLDAPIELVHTSPGCFFA
jgi:hypothetical protein